MGAVKPPFVYLGTTVFKETVEETLSHIDRLMNKKSSSKNVVRFNAFDGPSENAVRHMNSFKEGEYYVRGDDNIYYSTKTGKPLER